MQRVSKILHRKKKLNLETRVKEHFRNIKYKDIEKSAVAYHFWITQYKVENGAKLLKQAEKPLELTVWGKNLHPKKQKHHFQL